MPTTEIKSFYVNGFKQGWQPDLPPSHLAVDALSTVLNMNYTLGGGMKQRDGFTKITTDVAGQDVPDCVLFQRMFTTSGAHPNFTQQVLWFDEDDGTLYTQSFGELLEEWQLTTGTDLVDSTHSLGAWVAGTHNPRGWNINAITMESDIYISALRFNGKSSSGTVNATEDGTAGTSDLSLPIKYDVQAGTFSRPAVHALAGGTSGFPMGRVVITAYDRVFAANVYKQTATGGAAYRYQSRIYWSELTTPETWNSTSWIEVGGDDGTEITAMVPYGDTILIFKQNSVWVLTGTDPLTFALSRLDAQLGCEATWAATTYAGMVYFYDPQSGVWSYDGARFDNLSLPIQDTLAAAINRNAIFKSILFINQDRLFLTVPIGAVSNYETDRATHTYMYDMRLKLWTQWDLGWQPYPSEYVIDNTQAGAGATGDRKFFAGGVEHTKGIFKLEHGETDNGSAIDAYFETAWFNPDALGGLHRIRRLDVMASSTDANTISLSVYRDMKTSAAWATGTFTPLTGMAEWHEQDSDHDQGLFTWIKFKFANSVSGADFTINGVGVNYSNRRTMRGTRAGLITP